MTKETEEVKNKISEILNSNDAMTIASTGDKYSPWILGVYFASNELSAYVLLETDGKTMANLKINNKVAICISKNDAMQDFLQGYGEAVILDPSKESEVRQMILDKMPWFQTFTPVTPVRLDVKEYFVSSLNKGWFPAKRYELS